MPLNQNLVATLATTLRHHAGLPHRSPLATQRHGGPHGGPRSVCQGGRAKTSDRPVLGTPGRNLSGDASGNSHHSKQSLFSLSEFPLEQYPCPNQINQPLIATASGRSMSSPQPLGCGHCFGTCCGSQSSSASCFPTTRFVRETALKIELLLLSNLNPFPSSPQLNSDAVIFTVATVQSR